MEKELTIINSWMLRSTTTDWEQPETLFNCLRGPALDILLNIKKKSVHLKQSLRIFDALLYLLNEPPIDTPLFFDTPRFEELQLIYYGALASNKFISLKIATKIEFSRCFYNHLKCLSKSHNVRTPKFKPSTMFLDSTYLELFEKQYIRTDLIAEFKSYTLVDKHGICYNTNLHPMRQILGADYTNRFHKILAEYASKKAKDSGLRDFCTTFAAFIHTQQNNICVEELKDPFYIGNLLIRFQKFHFLKFTSINGGPQSGTLPSLQKLWTRYIIYLEILFKNELLSKPMTPLPRGNPSLSSTTEVRHQKTRQIDSELNAIITQKLITPLPLHLTDKEATELLFVQLKQDFDKVFNFLINYLESLFEHHRKGIKLALNAEYTPLESSCTKHFFSINHKNALGNVIRYFKDHHGGYCDTNVTKNLVFPDRFISEFNKSEVSNLLGLPTRHDAQVFMACISAIAPVITEAALADAQIFDRIGNRINAVNSNVGVVLSIRKDRKRSNQWSEVHFKDEAAVILEKWIIVTTPIRNYMQANNLPGWRNLIVYISSPLGKPSYFSRSSNMNSTFRSFLLHHQEELGRLSEIITFSRIRSTKGVLVFLESKDLNKMAEALGHSKETSLRHYMPDILWEYFSNRWIRIFQNLIIVEAAKNTPHLLQATDFSTMDELDSFLKVHAFRSNNSGEEIQEINSSGELFINASLGIFSVLKSLWHAVEIAKIKNKKIDGIALYWHEFTEKLGEHISNNRYKDYSIKNIWNNATIDSERFTAMVTYA